VTEVRQGGVPRRRTAQLRCGQPDDRHAPIFLHNLAQPRSNRPIGSELGVLLPRLWRVEELSQEVLDALVEQATIDAYGDDEQLDGFAVMIEDNLEMPFETTVPGVTVLVKGVTQTASGIMADCVRDGYHQAIHVLDLPLPEPPPKGAEWIAAYRHWARFA